MTSNIKTNNLFVKIPDKPFGDRSHAGTKVKPLALELDRSKDVEIADLPEN